MKGKIFAIVSAIILVISIIGATLALVYFRSDVTSVNLAVEPSITGFINYNSGTPVLGGDVVLNPTSTYTNGVSTEIEFWKTENAHNMDIYGHIYLDITSGSENLLNMEALKWAVTSNDILISEGNFIGYIEGNSVPILVNQKLLSTYTTFKVYVWIDENVNGSVGGEGEVFSVTVRCEATTSEYEEFGNSYEFDYTGSIQTIKLSKGTYALEVWGAQGGYGYNETYRGGYGGYSTGKINLDSGTVLFIAVGGRGGNGVNNNNLNVGGYNGGGNTYGTTSKYLGSGGGATHIALHYGLLSSLSDDIDDILLVAGGGGAGGYQNTSNYGVGGDAGGYIGKSGTSNTSYVVGTGGTQTEGGTGYINGSFGQGGAASVYNSTGQTGGGGGFYGGGAGNNIAGAGGGSGYIGNTFLTEKAMYCYNCSESSEDATKTISTTNVSEEPISNYAKQGNGYVKITSLTNQPYINIISRNRITSGTDYKFKNMVSEEIPEGYTIISSTYDNASTLSIGEYQIMYIAEDTSGNEYIYYQKIEIIG